MRVQLIIGFLILFISEILKVYFIMPFPGSQQSDTIELAYFLHQYIWYLRILGIVVLAYPLWKNFKIGSKLTKSILGGLPFCGLEWFIYSIFN
jgi:putative effector of murein hydrolase